MEDSALDEITQAIHIYYDGWRNGKIGAICDEKGNGIIRFFEVHRGKNGTLQLNHENIEDNPTVCVGIAAYWLVHRKSVGNLLKQLTPFGAHVESCNTVRQTYEQYTNMRFNQFKDSLRDNAETWEWESEDDWKSAFYNNHIIMQETKLNALSEPLFDFLFERDEKQVRSIMDCYIDYLKKCREKLLSKSPSIINEMPITLNIDEQRLRNHFKPIFQNKNTGDHIPDLINIINTTKTDIGIGQIALQIYESKFFLKDNFKTFNSWYREFCTCIGTNANPNYGKSKFMITEEEKKSTFYFLHKS